MSVHQYFSWDVPFDKQNSRHFVSVCFHRTQRGMRCLLTKRGHKDSSHTSACCWQNGRFDGKCVAEIHLALEGLHTNSIVHESVHAALHRCRLMGSKNKKWNEESIAYDVANVAGHIVALWRGIKRLKLGRKQRKSR